MGLRKRQSVSVMGLRKCQSVSVILTIIELGLITETNWLSQAHSNHVVSATLYPALNPKWCFPYNPLLSISYWMYCVHYLLPCTLLHLDLENHYWLYYLFHLFAFFLRVLSFRKFSWLIFSCLLSLTLTSSFIFFLRWCSESKLIFSSTCGVILVFNVILSVIVLWSLMKLK